MLLLAAVPINYALENLLCDVTVLPSTARRLFIKDLKRVSLETNQILLPLNNFIYADTVEKYVDFSLLFWGGGCVFYFLKDDFQFEKTSNNEKYIQFDR